MKYRKRPVVVEAFHWCPEGIGGEPYHIYIGL